MIPVKTWVVWYRVPGRAARQMIVEASNRQWATVGSVLTLEDEHGLRDIEVVSVSEMRPATAGVLS